MSRSTLSRPCLGSIVAPTATTTTRTARQTPPTRDRVQASTKLGLVVRADAILGASRGGSGGGHGVQC